jgi:hypothetical protein
MTEEKRSIEAHDASPGTSDDLKHTKTIDTIHQDEAVRVIAHYAGDEVWTAQEEKKLVRRLDRKLLSLLIITYGLQYYDKAMLSQAVSITSKPFCFAVLTLLGSIRLTG